MRDRINAMVKKREAFRPFAPACSLPQASRWFKLPAGEQHPYMISVVDVRAEAQALLPAITHVNGSARLQTVSEKDNPDFHALLVAVGETTGRQMVLNTSFNVKGQPIVNTPDEAIETFLGMESSIFSWRITMSADQLPEWNRTKADDPRGSTIAEAFKQQAALTPNAIAVVAGERRLSYREFDEHSNRLANHLQFLGVGPETLVGIFLGRTEHLIIGILAISKAGGAYVPLEPAHPSARLSLVIKDSEMKIRP